MKVPGNFDERSGHFQEIAGNVAKLSGFRMIVPTDLRTKESCPSFLYDWQLKEWMSYPSEFVYSCRS